MHRTYLALVVIAATSGTHAEKGFKLGAAMGEMQSGTWQNPNQETTYHEFIVIDGEDICTAPDFCIDSGCENDPSPGPWLNWCGPESTIEIDGTEYKIGADGDPCGEDVPNDKGSENQGKFYAWVLKAEDDSKKGFCQFDSSDIETCVIGLGSEPRSTSITCEMHDSIEEMEALLGIGGVSIGFRR